MERFLFNDASLPVVRNRDRLLPGLCSRFSRAVIWRGHGFVFKTTDIKPRYAPSLARKYFEDPKRERGRRISGETDYPGNVNASNVYSEAIAAGIHLKDDSVAERMADICNTLRATFRDVFDTYTGTQGIPLIGRILFTPAGGLGRSPELHIDNTILTLHWSAALIPGLRVYRATPDEKLWQALSVKNRGQQRNILDQALRAAEPERDIAHNRIGDVVIGKGQRDRDLEDPEVRETSLIHVSSDRIYKRGQAGFLITPKMP